ncbi:50S ribosomal protein l25-like [Trifolium pratense]|uniref:50S ribosomal protein l25-like n=1 Tax=Trifolium pratense TaxID=57577 RepID=A0A2K3PKI1_TRIPR|nr:50S ribosomal protein l25-like [Trifolium pratense]
MAQWWRSAVNHLRSTEVNHSSLSSLRRSHSYHTIQAIPRESTGSKVAARDRMQGRIPAVVFFQNLLEKNPESRSSSRKHLLTVEKKQIKAVLNSIEAPFFCSTRFPIQIRAGSGSTHLLESGTVLPIKIHRDEESGPIKIHRDEESGNILNLVFVWAEDGMDLKVDVPVVFKGEDDCPGLKKGAKGTTKWLWDRLAFIASIIFHKCRPQPDNSVKQTVQFKGVVEVKKSRISGFLNKIRTSLRYLGPSEHIPSKVEVDISNLDIEDRIFMRDIEVHPSLKLLNKNENMPICKIVPTSLGNQEPVAA